MKGQLVLTESEAESINETIRCKGYFFRVVPQQQAVPSMKPDVLISHVVKKAEPRKRQRSNPPVVKVSPVRITRRRREVCTGVWSDECIKLIVQLEEIPLVKSVLNLSIKENPTEDHINSIDMPPLTLDSIKKRLCDGLYSHPFRFQEDIRGILYETFRSNSINSKRWSDAVEVGCIFENLCRDVEGVNPYAVYSAIKSQPISHPAKPIQSSPQTIVMEASKLRELLARAVSHSVASDMANSHQPQNNVRTTATINAAPTVAPPVISSLPPPAFPTPPLPPLTTVLRSGERPPNTIHKRLMVTQFKALDVHLRLAALDLVRVELGIDPLSCCVDPEYCLDIELLPLLKQKQVLSYLRILETFQRRMVEEGLKPRMVGDLLASVAAAPKSRQQLPIAAAASPEPPCPADDIAEEFSTSSDDSFEDEERDDDVGTVPLAFPSSNIPAAVASLPTMSGKTLPDGATPFTHSYRVSDHAQTFDASEVRNISGPDHRAAKFFSTTGAAEVSDSSRSGCYDSTSLELHEQNSSSFVNECGTGDLKCSEIGGSVYGDSSELECSDEEDEGEDEEEPLNSSNEQSGWTEWKARSLQHKMKLKMEDESEPVFSTEKEREAELADAEI